VSRDSLWRQDELINAGKQLRLMKEAPISFSNHNTSRLSIQKHSTALYDYVDTLTRVQKRIKLYRQIIQVEQTIWWKGELGNIFSSSIFTIIFLLMCESGGWWCASIFNFNIEVGCTHHFCFDIVHVKPDMYTVWPKLTLPNDLRYIIRL